MTDSVASLPPELAQQHEIRVVPLLVIFGKQTFRDGVDMTPSQFYQRLRLEKDLPTTSAPSVGELVKLYEEVGRGREAVVSIHLTGDLSQTYESAVQAADMITSPPVHVVDTRTASMAQGFVALAAARAAQAGADAQTVLRVARETMPRVRLYAVLDTLEYLRRGGRMSGAAALVGSALRIRPILTVKDGKAVAVERPRTKNRAVDRMLELAVAELGDAPAHVAVVHAAAPEAAAELRDEVSRRLRCTELHLAEFTPVMGAHTGPGVLGLAFYAGDDETTY